MDLTGPLQIGGLPILPDSTSFQVKSKDFIGCIADVYIDYKLLDLNRLVNLINKYITYYCVFILLYSYIY